MDDADRTMLLEGFRAETEENLSAMEQGLLQLESAPDDDEATQAVFRAAHTLKANASVIGAPEVVELAHTVEEQIDRVRSRAIPATPAIVTMLLRATDALRDLVGRAGVASAEGPHHFALAASETTGTTLRVEVRRLDAMLDTVGQMAITRARLARRLEAHNVLGHCVLDDLADSENLLIRLQELVLQARLVPLGCAIRPLTRVVRDVARSCGKIAHLEIDGADLEVDTRIVEQLRAPLAHLLVNAVDHGIEPPEVRRERGKNPAGTVRIAMRHDHGYVVIELSDDGTGLDREAIANRARQMGLRPETSCAVDRLIFEPGLSTAPKVTRTSGRGMGMDVVRRKVESLGGSVDICGEAGVGTTVRLRVPLTVTILDGFVVEVAEELYVMPMPLVVECLDYPKILGRGDTDRIVDVRGVLVPCVRLRGLLGLRGPTFPRESVVVVRHERRLLGLVVDALYGNRQTVVKSMSRVFRGTTGMGGTAIWGDGRIALILDVPSLLRQAQPNGATSLSTEGKAA